MKKTLSIKNLFLKEDIDPTEQKEVENALNSMTSLLNAGTIEPGNPALKDVEKAVNSLKSLMSPNPSQGSVPPQGLRLENPNAQADRGFKKQEPEDAFGSAFDKHQDKQDLTQGLSEPFKKHGLEEDFASAGGFDIESMVKEFSEEEMATMLRSVRTGSPELLSGQLLQKLYHFFLDSGEMPIGIAKAREGDPEVWINDKLDSIFKDSKSPFIPFQPKKKTPPTVPGKKGPPPVPDDAKKLKECGMDMEPMAPIHAEEEEHGPTELVTITIGHNADEQIEKSGGTTPALNFGRYGAPGKGKSMFTNNERENEEKAMQMEAMTRKRFKMLVEGKSFADDKDDDDDKDEKDDKDDDKKEEKKSSGWQPPKKGVNPFPKKDADKKDKDLEEARSFSGGHVPDNAPDAELYAVDDDDHDDDNYDPLGRDTADDDDDWNFSQGKVKPPVDEEYDPPEFGRNFDKHDLGDQQRLAARDAKHDKPYGSLTSVLDDDDTENGFGSMTSPKGPEEDPWVKGMNAVKSATEPENDEAFVFDDENFGRFDKPDPKGF